MGNIIELPQTIIAQIAAGEVIERPAYAVKELLENSIDAGADSIRIVIENGGLKKIQVIDNGQGMDSADLGLCWQPHTTSKFSSISDFQKIKSLGFRGEALASIAAISDTVIASRQDKDAVGSQIEIRGGECREQSSIGMPCGTTITVKNLFSHVPARKKFLKSERTEWRSILEIVTHIALANPTIRIQLEHNGKPIFDLPKNQSVIDRIKILLGSDLHRHLVPIRFEDSYIKISGYLGKPQIANGTSSKQFVYINSRFVQDQLIASAVKDAFNVLIASSAHPAFVLFLEMPYDLVDVNVHPRKEQIKFFESQFIYDVVKSAISQTLAEHNLTYLPDQLFDSDSEGTFRRSTESFAGQLLKQDILIEKPTIGSIIRPEDNIQIHQCYLVFQTTEGLIVVDQHAAHERVLYEEFRKRFLAARRSCAVNHHPGHNSGPSSLLGAPTEEDPRLRGDDRRESGDDSREHEDDGKGSGGDSAENVTVLKKPAILDLSLTDIEVIIEYIDTFSSLGFAVEQFGASSIKVTAVPKLFTDRNISKLVAEILEDLKSDRGVRGIDAGSDRMLKFLSCRAAIKSGDRITKDQAWDLITKLEQTDMAYTCPHGRPAKVEISQLQLDKLFKRR